MSGAEAAATLRIKAVEFAGAVGRPGQDPPPGELPEVAFAGRSNVGKSSLINRLLGRTRTQMARVSATPGKTREINFYHVRAELDGRDTEFFLVDLPGYGYARVPDAVRRSWADLLEAYLREAKRLRGVVQLIDARHDPTSDDLRMVGFLSELGVPALFVLTKIDKVKRGQRAARTEVTRKQLGLEPDQVVAFSARTGAGREPLLQALGSLLWEAA